MMNYKDKWSQHFSEYNESYPSELLIRILKGNYPKLKFDKNFIGKKILDMGCANGANTCLLASLNFEEIVGVDITKELIELAEKNVKRKYPNSNCNFFIGKNNAIPIENDYFDYAVSWGVSYYMSIRSPKDKLNVQYSDNIQELHRVLKPDGVLILDVPQWEGDIYDNAIEIRDKYWEDKNGLLIRRFSDICDITKELDKFFANFSIAITNLDCFGKNYSRYTIVCRKK